MQASSSIKISIKKSLLDDININLLLHLPQNMENAEEVLCKYVNQDIHPARKILFMTRIMEVLWNVLESDPSQDRNVFDALVQTIHPIITNSTEFGYAQEYLERYIENEFKNSNVYDLIIDGFEKMLTIAQEDFQQNQEKIICKYALMSMKLICRIIVKAFMNKGSQDKDRFEKLVFSVGHYLQSKDSRENHGKAFRSFFDIENLEVITLLVTPCTVLDILDATLDQMKEANDPTKYQVVCDLIKSKLFEEKPDTLSKIAVELIQSSVKPGNSIDHVLNYQLQQALLPLIKALYERTKRAKIERRQDLLDYLVENLFLILIKIAPQGKPEKGSEVEVLLISLMTEIKKECLEKLAQIKDFPGHLQKLFIILQNQRTSENSFITELSYEIRVNLLHDISMVLDLLSEYLLNMKVDIFTSYATIEAMFVAISSIVCHKDIMFFNLSVQKRNYYIRKYGDIQLFLCQVLKKVVDALYPEKLYKIIEYNPFDIPLLEAIFSISLDVRKEARDMSINLMLTCLESEYHGTDAESGKKLRNIQLCYTWFIARVLQSFRNNTHITDLEYRKAFQTAIITRRKLLKSEHHNVQDNENFVRKLGMIMSHLAKLVEASVASVKTEERFKENEVILLCLVGYYIITNFRTLSTLHI